jgi:hypothetical protein
LIRRWCGLFTFDGPASGDGAGVAILLKWKVVEGAENRGGLSFGIESVESLHQVGSR